LWTIDFNRGLARLISERKQNSSEETTEQQTYLRFWLSPGVS